MDMHIKDRDALVFHMTGRRAGDGLAPVAGLDLRPALLAPYRDLDALRHDFPLVLVQRGKGADFVRTLSSLVDTVLKDVAPRGIEGERLRRHALQLEQQIRRTMADGTGGTLAERWDAAAAQLGAREGETLEQVLVHAGTALRADGEVLGCTQDMPARLLRHAWEAANREKAQQFNADLSRLVQKLSDILRAAYSHSQAGRQPQSLRASVGGPHQAAFDFDALSRFIGKGAPQDELPATRRARLTRVLSVLGAQRFFAPADPQAPADCFNFVFDDCASAAQAFRQRLPDALALVKAMAIADLEVQGRYAEAEHDLYFESFDEHALSADDLARLPDDLVCIPPNRNDAPENASLMEMLSSGLPVKVLVQTADLLEDASIGTGHFAFGVRSARLATAAMGLGGMFVLQSTSANLYAVREQIAAGLACRGPALFSVFAGAAEPASALPPYLSAAAAMQSRAFPAFCYDAAAGNNWATRFSLANNPQPEDDWATETLVYADADQQRTSVPCAFTFADFVLCDTRYASHFAIVPRERWNASQLSVADWLALDEADAAKHVPYLLAVNAQDELQRVVVDSRVMQATRRCLLLWRRLQEHGHVHDRRPAAPEAEPAAATAAPAQAPAVDAQAEPAALETTHSRDEAWIDTARCPSCNECQLINDRMFGYDERKQAYIKDLTAGTYRQLVEAAESCQVAIIHPGAPQNPNEPGLPELLARAEAFR